MLITKAGYSPATFAMTARALSSITDLIIHHSAGSTQQTAIAIDREHRLIGDAMIGYNFVITPDGTVYDGRPLCFVPAAAYGRNLQSVNVCIVGNFQSDDRGYTGPPTSEQIASLKTLAAQLHTQIPSICRTIGHRDVAPLFYAGDGDYATACPGDKLYALLADVRAYCAAQRRHVA